MSKTHLATALVATILTAGMSSPVGAAQAAQPEVKKAPEAAPGADASELAKQLQNPVSNLISVPLQNNLDYDIGPFDRARYTLNIQPVIPIRLSDRWMLVTRTIIPFLYQPDVIDGEGGSSGMGDINPTFFVSPVKPGKLTWGVGPTLLLPTATQTNTGAGQWAVGPAAVVVTQPAPWTLGLLANQLWSFAGEGGRV